MALKSLLFRVLRLLLIVAMVAGAMSAAIPLVAQFVQDSEPRPRPTMPARPR